MKLLKVILILFVLAAIATAAVLVMRNSQRPEQDMRDLVKPAKKEFIFKEGETLTYDIKKFYLTVGEASLTFEGPATIDGRDAYLIVFRAEAVKFFDEEKIYVDPETFYPMVVDRDLNIFGKKEKIREEYLTDSGEVKITKRAANGKTTTQVIKKDGDIDNIYTFIYRYRQDGTFKINEVLSLNLPTQDVVVELLEKIKLKVADNIYAAYYLQSRPAQYHLWFDTGPQKIPLKIKGALGPLKAELVLANRPG